MRWRLARCGLISLLLCCACRASAPREPQPDQVRRVPPPLPTSAESRLSLAERLASEASLHPEARRRVDAWFARFSREGIKLHRTRQVLAAALLADYCATGVTASGLGFSLCEFADAGAAELGLQRSQAMFGRLIPGRALSTRSTTLLTLMPPETQAAHEEAAVLRAVLDGVAKAQRAAL